VSLADAFPTFEPELRFVATREDDLCGRAGAGGCGARGRVSDVRTLLPRKEAAWRRTGKGRGAEFEEGAPVTRFQMFELELCWVQRKGPRTEFDDRCTR
jgi:hypothetical protein